MLSSSKKKFNLLYLGSTIPDLAFFQNFTPVTETFRKYGLEIFQNCSENFVKLQRSPARSAIADGIQARSTIAGKSAKFQVSSSKILFNVLIYPLSCPLWFLFARRSCSRVVLVRASLEAFTQPRVS